MAGFANWREYGDARTNGAVSYATYRKVATTNRAASTWYDMSMAAGSPPPNYYASSPLEAATLNGLKGLYHGGDKSPAQLYLERFYCTTTTVQVQQAMLCDYLLYYPFIDGDSTDAQAMTNDVTLPRYTTGQGVQGMLVAVAPTTGGGTFTFDYINQDGAQKTAPVQSCETVSTPIGGIVTHVPATIGGGCFVRLADGDTGIRSVVSFTHNTVNGGLTCLVLVKPLADFSINETSVASEYEYGGIRSLSQRIYDGAYLSIICKLVSANAPSIVGHASFVWG